METRAEAASPHVELDQEGTELLFDVAPTLSFAAEQAGVPLIRAGTVRHFGPDVLEGSEIEFRLEPSLSEPHRVRIPTLLPLDEHDLGAVDVRLPPGRLREVRETERARLVWKLWVGEEAIASGGSDVEVLPYNHWPGLRAPPGLLASFVTPNHAVVAQLLKRTSARLEAETGQGALDGYQSRDPERVRALTRALYEEITSLGLTYVGAPASFEVSGQKVRLPDQILAEQLGCCLDLSLLFASCLEQMRLAPLIVLVQGHAFPAVWLVDDRFPEGLIEDASRMRTQLDLGQILPFESTLVTQGANFEQAVENAIRELADDSRYLYTLDVRACRSEFRPIPLRDVGVPVIEAGPEPTPQRIEIVRILREASEQPQQTESIEPPPEDIAARFRRWKDRLLDLSLRNRLLNLRPERREVLPLEIPDVSVFEDLLATNERLEIVGRPVLQVGDSRARKTSPSRMTDEVERRRLLDDLARRIVHCSVPQDRLVERATELVRAARTDLEEGGACTLFVTIGVLQWIEPGSSLQRYAPLILYPAELSVDRGRRRVSIHRLVNEDPLANVTLIEKFRRDFGIDLSELAALEQDDAGLDVRKLLDGVRRRIQGRRNFEVLDIAYVARLSFSKFLMWRDLEDNANALLDNPVVRHIADPKGDWEDPVGEVLPGTLDESYPPKALPTVLDADSTQLAAIAATLRGRSLVLQGPPGTGKSQTITNLIAAAVAEGKSVLFVSEKMAALEVVYKRLQSVGLGDFCLELHSHKSNKRDVLDSFARVLDRKERTDVRQWEEASGRLVRLRERLNEYASVLHRQRPSGLTVFEASARLRALRSAPEVRIPIEDPTGLSAERIRELQEAAEALADRAQAVEPLASNPWRGARKATYSVVEEEKLADALGDVLDACRSVDGKAADLESFLGISAPRSVVALRQVVDLALAASEGELPEAALSETWADVSARALAFLRDERELQSAKSELGKRWDPALLEQSLDELHSLFVRRAEAPSLVAWFFLRGARKRLASMARGSLGSHASIRDDLARALFIQRESARLERSRPELQHLLDAGLLERGRVLLAASHIPREARRELAARSMGFGSDRRGMLARGARELADALDALEAGETSVREIARMSFDDAWPLADDPRQVSELERLCRAMRENLPGYRAHCLYREAADRLEGLGHGALVQAFSEGKLEARQLPMALERNLLSRWLNAITDQEPVLRTFDRPSQERLTSEFATLDRRHLELSRDYVIACAEARLPAPNDPQAKSELQLLRREIAKKTRQMAVRRLLQSLPTLLPRLKPCLLMSPLSVAQYLPATARFDLVVFDEASQIGTHDAIGALARGKQVVIVGDSRQLPPTTFFQRAGSEEDDLPDDNDVAELESVLEEAVARGLPQQMLGWHYRSRHESLIDFSNKHYYDERLFVFPAARRAVDDLGVKWHPVPDGVFQSGELRVNRREAEVLVEHLVSKLRTSSPKERTYGVVTFSLAQCRLIEDLIDEARSLHPEIEAHFTSDEPVFVKNLENVQGDERDEILFSVGYAKDEKGRLRMHFGPLSNKGGERRLNVAITRARKQLRVFSTLRPEDIDLARTHSIGAAHLRAFLQFAARQSETTLQRPAPVFESPFHREIHDALTMAGYRVIPSVGCAGYRIDLAVEHPRSPGTYLLGIELDGPRWARGETARDRERLRKEVLASLGWQLARVWTPAWSRDPKGETRRLVEQLEAALRDG